MAGRPPKPTRLKILTGNPGGRPLNAAEPSFPPGVPKCPAWLPSAAKKVWKRVVPLLEKSGLVTLADEDTLSAYCVAVMEHQEATATLAGEGRRLLVGGYPSGENGAGPVVGGQWQPHPAVSQQRSAWAALRQFSALFGLDPSSRGRLALPPAKSSDPFDDFLKSKGGA